MHPVGQVLHRRIGQCKMILLFTFLVIHMENEDRNLLFLLACSTCNHARRMQHCGPSSPKAHLKLAKRSAKLGGTACSMFQRGRFLGWV
jgi:hypothetical protein